MCSKYKKLEIGILIFSVLLIGIRTLGLDKDLPGFGVSFYQPIDEGIYSRMAINLYNSGSLYNTGNYELFTGYSFRTNIIGNMIQFLTMHIFGDNYFGFRISYVLFAIMIVILLYFSIHIICENYAVSLKIKWGIVIVCMIYVLTDFTFLMAGRVVENSILRALVILIMVFCFLRYRHQRISYFFLGFFSIISIFFVYASNLFVLVPIGTLLLFSIINRDYKHTREIAVFVFAGIALGIFLAEIYYIGVWKEEAFYNLYKSIFSFSDRVGTTGGEGISNKILSTFAKNGLSFWAANIFFFSPGLMVGTLYATYVNIKNILKYKDEFLLIIVSLIGGFWLQTIVASDYIERKIITLYPIFIINIILAVINEMKKKRTINGNAIGQSNTIGKSNIIGKNIKFAGLVLLSSVITWYSVTFRIEKKYNLDFENVQWEFATYFLFIGTVFSLVVVAGWIYPINLRIIKLSIIGTVLSFLSVNIFFSICHVYCNKKFTEKEAMIAIGEQIGNDYTLGSYSYGFTLYNDIIPVANEYTKVREYMGDIKYMIDYATYANVEQYINPVVFESQVPAVEIYKSYERSISTLGARLPIGILVETKQ